jgi:hypothetical protein
MINLLLLAVGSVKNMCICMQYWEQKFFNSFHAHARHHNESVRTRWKIASCRSLSSIRHQLCFFQTKRELTACRGWSQFCLCKMQCTAVSLQITPNFTPDIWSNLDPSPRGTRVCTVLSSHGARSPRIPPLFSRESGSLSFAYVVSAW